MTNRTPSLPAPPAFAGAGSGREGVFSPSKPVLPGLVIGHAGQGYVLLPLLNRGELAVLYCFVFLFFAAAGPGAWSLDGLRTRRVAVA